MTIRIQHVRHLAPVPDGSVFPETADRPRESGVIEKTAFEPAGPAGGSPWPPARGLSLKTAPWSF